MKFSDFSPSEFAASWYQPDFVEKQLASESIPPADFDSRGFAEWLTEKLRSAMAQGIELTRNDFDARNTSVDDSD